MVKELMEKWRKSLLKGKKNAADWRIGAEKRLRIRGNWIARKVGGWMQKE